MSDDAATYRAIMLWAAAMLRKLWELEPHPYHRATLLTIANALENSPKIKPEDRVFLPDN